MTVEPTSGPADWWARPLRPSDAARGLDRWLLDRTGGGGKDYLACLVGAFVVVVLALFGPFAEAVAAACMVLAWAFGMLRFAAVHRRRGWSWEAFALVAVPAVASMLLLYGLGQPWAASLLGLAVAEGLARRPAAPEPGQPLADRWYTHNTLRDALVRAGVLPKTDDDGGPPQLGYRGKLRRDDVGEWQTVDLPAPLTWRDAAKAHERIARSLDLPAERLHLEHERGKPEGYVTFAVLAERKALPAAPSLPARTDWAQPVPLGADRLGRAQSLRTLATHTAFVGKTRSGKTWLARYFAAHAILDPRVPLIMVSGKDDPEDWQPMRPLCFRYETVADLDGVLDLFRTMERVGDYRGTLPKAERQPALFVIDEWYRLRTMAEVRDRRMAEELAKRLSTLAATLASRNVHIVMTFQRGTDTYIGSDLRANLGQKAVGMVAKESETRIVLDMVPEATPTAPGEFLLTVDDSEPTLVQAPSLTDDGFSALCERAGRMRADEPHAPLLPDSEAPAPPAPAVLPEDRPLVDAVRHVLTRHGALTTSRLWELLPADVRPGGPVPLGKHLGSLPGVAPTRVGETRARGWEAVPLPARLPVHYPPDEQPVPVAEAVHLPAQDGYSGAHGPVPGSPEGVPVRLKAVP